MSIERGVILVRMKTVIAEQLEVDAATVNEGTSFVDDLGADSLAIVELVLAMEEEFDVAIPDDQAEALKTVGDAVTFVVAHAGQKGTPKKAAS